MPTPTVLVADDEPHITQVLTLKLRNAGINVLTAHDGEEALEMIIETLPDLVITDLQMPYMSGIELCKELYRHDAARDIPVIVLTARGLGLAPEDLADTNIRSVLSKPFSPRQTLDRVQELLADIDRRREADAA